MTYRGVILCCLSALLCLAACKKEAAAPGVAADENTPTYFSIRQFGDDQLKTNLGLPFTMTRKVTENGKTDSSIENSFHADWAEVFAPFYATDISDTGFLGKYTFSTFVDNASDSRVLYYEAKEPGLFTKTLQIRIDPENNKILSLYIETGKSSFWKDETGRLYYVPNKLIQIQQFEDPLIGSRKQKTIEYTIDR